VWGDPALYDGTIRIIETILEQGRLELDYRVIRASAASSC